jgi:hypothetical protein
VEWLISLEPASAVVDDRCRDRVPVDLDEVDGVAAGERVAVLSSTCPSKPASICCAGLACVAAGTWK